MDAFAQWQSIQSGTQGRNYYSVFFISDSVGFFADCAEPPNAWSYNSFLKTIDAGNNWNGTSLGGNYCASPFYFVNENIGYVSYKADPPQGKAVIKTIDGGATWFLPNNSGTTSNGASSIYFLNDTIGFAAMTPGYIHKTINGAESWMPISYNSTSNISSVFFTSSQTGFAVGNNNPAILKTADTGNNWNVIDTNYALLSVFFPSSNIGYAVGFNGTVVKTTDAGNNWTQQNSGLSNNISLFSIYCSDTNICYAVGDSGTILKTTDGGLNWQRDSSGTNQNLNSIFCTSDVCYAVGDSGIILKTTKGGEPVSVGGIGEKNNEIKIYPNPFSTCTTIEFQNKNNERHTLSIYNSTGQLVRKIEKITNGIVRIERKALKSGLYFFQLMNNTKRVGSGKIIIEK